MKAEEIPKKKFGGWISEAHLDSSACLPYILTNPLVCVNDFKSVPAV